MNVSQNYYGTVVLGGSGSVYAIDEVSNAFDRYCHVWLVGTAAEIVLHMARHGVNAVSA